MIQLDPLPFPEGSLAPYLSEETVHLHYTRHHAGYIRELNHLLKGTIFEKETNLEHIVRSTRVDSYIFNNAAQAWSHNFYWNSMTPSAKSIASDRFVEYLSQHNSSIDKIAGDLITIPANTMFGSGWLWLLSNDSGVFWYFTPNAETTHARLPSCKILLACDIWEHAYCYERNLKRQDYLTNYCRLINWSFADRNLFGENV